VMAANNVPLVIHRAHAARPALRAATGRPERGLAPPHIPLEPQTWRLIRDP
jgi:hypothetical protein